MPKFTHYKLPGYPTPEEFDAAGIYPAEMVLAMSGRGEARRGAGAGLSPSMLDPEATCRRKVAISRYHEGEQDPINLWAASSGTLWHEVFAKYTPDGWTAEQQWPRPEDEGKPGVRRNLATGTLEWELFPGVWISGRIDRVKDDFSAIVDFKNQRASKRDWGAKPGWTLQLNAYQLMVEALTGARCESLVVWRQYVGTYEPETTWRKFDVPLMGKESMQARIGRWAMEFQQMLDAVSAANGSEESINTLPMDGKSQFGGKHCSQYCSCRDFCYRLAGEVTF